MIRYIISASFIFTFSISIIFSAVQAQDNGFFAEGLTEPVVPARGEDAVRITFPDHDFIMRFDPPGRAGYVTPEGIGTSNEWAETASIEKDLPEWGEVLFDRNAVMWLESDSPARKVVRFRGVIKTPEGEILHADVDSGSPYGEGDWSDEWYYIYPDGVSVRVIKIYTGRTEDAVAFWGLPGHCAFWGIRGTVFETQETFIHGVPGKQPWEIIEQEALTLITMDGDYKRINYKPYPPDCSLFDPANIQMVNLKSKYHPFTIVKEGNVEVKPYYMPMEDHRHIDSTVFITWPRKGHFDDGDYTTAISHVIKWGWHHKTENTIEQVYLLGMIDDPEENVRVDKLVALAKNWQYAPRLVVKNDGIKFERYEIKEKAYILNAAEEQKELSFTIKASDKNPLINPVLVIKGINGDKAVKLKINDKEFNLHRTGIEKNNMVIWIPFNSKKETDFKILF